MAFVPSVPLVPRPKGSAFGDSECVGVRGRVESDATVMAAVGVTVAAAAGAAPRVTVGWQGLQGLAGAAGAEPGELAGAGRSSQRLDPEVGFSER